MKRAQMERFRKLSVKVNNAKGKKFTVTEADWLMLRKLIIEQMERNGQEPIPWCDSDGDMLFRGKGLVIES